MKKINENLFLRNFLIIILFFVFDSFVNHFLPTDFMKTGISFVCYSGLMMYTLLVGSFKKVERFAYGAVCGAYYAVVYGDSFVIYILIYCFIAFFLTYLLKIEQLNLPESMMLGFLTIFLQEALIYCLMWISGTTQIQVDSFVIYFLLPTLLFNMILSPVVYAIYNKLV